MRLTCIVALFVANLAIAQDRSDPISLSRDTEPKVISRVEPNFPEVSLREQMTLKVYVNSKGMATRIVVLKSQGIGVDEAALSAVQRWRFQAGTRDGVPVDSTTIVSFP